MKQSKMNLCFSLFFYGLFFVAIGVVLIGFVFKFNDVFVFKALGVAFFVFLLAIFSAFCEYGTMSKRQLYQYGAIPNQTDLCITQTRQ